MRLSHTLLLSACAASNAVLAVQVANFILTASVAAQYGCQGECATTLAAAEIGDDGDTGLGFDLPFYATAGNLSASLAPGEILKFEVVDANNLTLLSGVTIYRIQYTSIDLDGSVVPVTGFVAFPQGTNRLKDGKFPVVAYAHGTSELNCKNLITHI